MAAAGTSGKTYSFKAVLLGEGCVGKTSLVLRYCENKFNDKHITTLQVRQPRWFASRLSWLRAMTANRSENWRNVCGGLWRCSVEVLTAWVAWTREAPPGAAPGSGVIVETVFPEFRFSSADIRSLF